MLMGFAKVDITPELPAPMAGQPFNCVASGVTAPLYLRALRMGCADTAVLIISADALGFSTPFAAELRALAARAGGVKYPSHVALAATHTHSGPSVVTALGAAVDARYEDRLRECVVNAACRAVGNAVPAEFEIATGTAQGLGFNRRFIMSDGTIETHPLKSNPHIVRAEGPDARHLAGWRARDGRGRCVGGLLNFGCHGTCLDRRNTLINGDYPGYAAQSMAEKMAGAPALFLQGAAGNICQVNPLDPARREVGDAWARKLGGALAEQAWTALEHAEIGAGRLRVAHQNIKLPRRHIPEDLLHWARRQQPAGADLPRMPELSDYGVEHFGQLEASKHSLADFMRTSYWAAFQAREILALADTLHAGSCVDFEIMAICQDNWALVFLPCELFVEWGDALVAASPFRHTGIVTLSNGWHGYIPTERAFERSGGYETKLLSSSFLAPESGALVLDGITKLLRELQGGKV